MSQDHSESSNLIRRLRTDDAEATEWLWSNYFQPLVELASHKLGNHRAQRITDAEDAAMEVLQAFLRGVRKDKFPDLRHRDDLWRLLFTITDRRCLNLIRDYVSQGRGSGRVRGDSILDGNSDVSDRPRGFDQLEGRAMAPEDAASLKETLTNLMQALREQDVELCRIAILRMEGHTNKEIADLLGRSLATVERRLAVIRAIWSNLYSSELLEEN